MMWNMLTRIMNFMINSYNNLSVPGRHTISFSRFLGRIAIVPLVLLFLNSCEEDPSRIGGSILPSVDFDQLGVTDTLTVDMYTMFIDTIRSSMPSSSYMGKYSDPVFGTTTAGFVTQLWLYANWPGGGIGSVDSVMFYLSIYDIIGADEGDGILNIYEIDKYIDEDSVYYVNSDVPLKELLVSIPLAGITGDTLLTYKLGASLGETLLRDTTKLFLSSDSADFRTSFYGLYFEYLPTAEDHIFDVDILSGNSFFNVHYTNGEGQDAIYSYSINSKCVRYNRSLHDFTTADSDKKINHINDNVKDTLTYLQSFQGVFTRVDIPGLEALKTGKQLGVNKASLVLPAFKNDDYFTEDNLISAILLARYINSEGEKEYLPDYLLSSDFFDGAYYSLDTEFRINIVNFIQMYFDGEIQEPSFELFIPSNIKNNIILRSNNPEVPCKLELVYTEVR